MRTNRHQYFLDLATRCAHQGELNRCWRNDHNIPSGSNYERCRSVHAEMNALLQAGKHARGCTLYLAGFEVTNDETTQIWPCFLCSKMIVNSGIANVIMKTGPDTWKEMDPMVLYQMRSRESLGEDAQ
jgi:dCMP deaminase